MSQVSSWRENIAAVMKEQDSRPAFDIRKTGKEIVARAGSLYKTKSKALDFGEIIDCEHRYQVARHFSAFLQQVNEGNVELVRGEVPSDPFYVKVPVCH
jgi:condensin-2 complex subunit H2